MFTLDLSKEMTSEFMITRLVYVYSCNNVAPVTNLCLSTMEQKKSCS